MKSVLAASILTMNLDTCIYKSGLVDNEKVLVRKKLLTKGIQEKENESMVHGWWK